MHVSAVTGGPEFFGGDEPRAVTREPNNEKYASYPATFTLKGSVDEATGQVTIDAPLAQFGLRADDALQGLQVFSMTGLLPERTLYTPLDVVDMTPAVSRPLSLPKVLGTHEKRLAGRPLVGGEQLPGTGVGDPLAPGTVLVIAAVAAAIARRRYAR
jgi:hypothetical protein